MGTTAFLRNVISQQWQRKPPMWEYSVYLMPHNRHTYRELCMHKTSYIDFFFYLCNTPEQYILFHTQRDPLGVLTVKNACSVGNSGLISGGEDPLEKGMVTHSSILAWRIPQMEEPGGLQSTGSQRVRHDWATNTHTHTHTHTHKPIVFQILFPYRLSQNT